MPALKTPGSKTVLAQVVGSAVLLALAFAGLWPLLFVALIPLMQALRSAETSRQAWNRGYGFGLLFSLTQLWWLGDLAYKWTENNVFLGLLPWVLASLLTAVYYGLLGRLVRSCWIGNVAWAIPLVWAGMEVFRSYIPVLAFPWALLAEPLIAVPALAGDAYYGTIYLVSALVVAINVAWLLPKRVPAVVGAAVALLFGAIHFNRPVAAPKKFAAGQPGVDMAFDEAANERIGPAVDELFSKAQGVDLLVLPEGISQGGASLPPKTPFHVPAGMNVVFGGQRGRGPVYQSAFAHGPEGWSYADKTRLVIFGEFVPGRDLFPFLGNAFHLPGGDLSAGNKVSSVHAGGMTVGPLICFEALFPDLAWQQSREASVLAVMSIDDWFALPARKRLAQAAQWRAIETGKPVIRAGSLGKTMIVSPYGDIVAEVPFGGTRLVEADEPPRRDTFPLVWLFPAVSAFSLVLVPLGVRRKLSKRKS